MLGLPELIAALEFAAIISGLVPVGRHMAVRPAQEQVWPQGKDNSFAAYLRLNAWALGRRRQAEVQRAPENYGIGFSYQVAGHGMNHLGLEQEGGCIRPVAHRHIEMAALRRKVFQFDFGERAWSCNA